MICVSAAGLNARLNLPPAIFYRRGLSASVMDNPFLIADYVLLFHFADR